MTGIVLRQSYFKIISHCPIFHPKTASTKSVSLSVEVFIIGLHLFCCLISNYQEGGGGVETPLICLIRSHICSYHQANQVLWTPIVVYYGSLGTKQQSLDQSFMIRTLICLAFRDRRGRDRMVVGFIICNQCLSPLTLWVVLDTTLCDKVCQWRATGRWFSPCTLVSSTNKTDRHDITEIFLKWC